MAKTRIQLEFLPPSVNHIWRHTRRFGKPVTYRTEQYQTWLNSVGYSVNRQTSNQPKWHDPIYITIAMRRPRSNADIDNRIKPCLDLLQYVEVIKDDKLVEGVNAYWSKDLPDGIAAEIIITPAASPFAREAA